MFDLTNMFRVFFPSSSFRTSGLIATFAFLICLLATSQAQAQTNTGSCTPTTTVTEGDLFPGGLASFTVTSGPGSVTVDHVDRGTGLQSFTVVSATNAIVTIPAFTPGTFAPVTATFTVINPSQPVDFTLRAASSFHAIFIRVQCGAVTPPPNSNVCTPTTTVTEGDLFPGGLASFTVTSGPGSVTVDHVDRGTGLQSFTVVSATNAIVTIPAFTPGTFAPVTATFTVINPSQPVDFTLRAASSFHAIFIRVQCGAVTPPPNSNVCTPTTTVTEGDLFPGGLASFTVTSGPGSVTVDHVNAGTGLQSLTVVGVPVNAVVNIPPFTPGTFNPVTVTFTPTTAGVPVDFTLRAASTFHAIFIRARCETTGLGTTAATVSVGGRVKTSTGRGIRNVVITMTDSQGNIRTARTTSFGYYRFEEVAAGETYIFMATGKRFSFGQNTQVHSIIEDISDINFIANDQSVITTN